MDDLISRQAVINEMKDMYTAAEKWGQDAKDDETKARAESCMATNVELKLRIEKLPSVQPETKPISYLDCANAMLMMWMDEVVTDGEYNRIMDKLNAHELKKRSKNG